MKFFLDTANLDEIRHGIDRGLLDGVATSPELIARTAKAGADIAAVPFQVLQMLFDHPLTSSGSEQFLQDWGKVFQEAPVAG